MFVFLLVAKVHASFLREMGWTQPSDYMPPPRPIRFTGTSTESITEASRMVASEKLHELAGIPAMYVAQPGGGDVQTSQLRANDASEHLTPTDVTGGALCRSGPRTTSFEALFQDAKSGVEKLYDVNTTSWIHHGSDDTSQWASEGGMQAAHVYGEVTRQGMFDALKTAACVAEPAECDTAEKMVGLFQKMQFYDLGSGQGKFPMFASLLGFSFSKGIELDHHRAGYAQDILKQCNQAYPCLAKKLAFGEGSFVDDNAAWMKGSNRRVLFTDAICFEGLWPKVARMMKQGAKEWGKGTVVISLGREHKPESGLELVKKMKIGTSWTEDGSLAYFYRFGEAALH